MRTIERPIPQEEVRRVLENRKIPRKRKYLRRAIKLLTYQQNSLFTAIVRVGLSSRADNINCLILGGAGTGKSRSFIIICISLSAIVYSVESYLQILNHFPIKRTASYFGAN